ncbi:MAG: maleylpyruvate isomerase [Actinomycetota bacterium]
MDSEVDLRIDIDGCAAATALLLRTLESLTDEHARQPSLLPGWSVGHVLTHVARNADSVVRMVEAAQRGEVVFQYAEGQREREIEEGSGRSARELVDDVARAADVVVRAWDATSDDVWATGMCKVRSGDAPINVVPLRRWREVELHHADLGLGFTYADMSPEYVAREESGVSPPPFGGRDPSG